jgi:hypothetical protein
VLRENRSRFAFYILRSHLLRRQLYRVDDVLVAGTAAEIPRDGFSDVLFGGIGVTFQERHQAHQNAWGAEATLYGVSFPEGFLKGMQVIHGSQSFDCENLMAVGLHSKHQAGPDRFSIKQNGASATYTVLAADVRASQAKLMAQEIAQQQARLDGALVLGAIDSDCHSE